MVSKQSVKKQLKHLDFNYKGWGRSEVSELHNILLPGEEIHEVANGFYEGGFGLLVATDIRVLLIDKKPLNYLKVEDLRFDMINEMDYSHRLMGAFISIATGNKNLKFTCINQPRLRKLISHVQHSMADAKRSQSAHQEDQNSHLQQINQQLQTYLIAQQQYQLQMQQFQQGQVVGAAAALKAPVPVKPSPELSDFLFAQNLIAEHKTQDDTSPQFTTHAQKVPVVETKATDQMIDLYNAGLQEVYGKAQTQNIALYHTKVIEINPLKIAYSKLPMALRNRKFGRPSFHATSVADFIQTPIQPQPAPTEV